MTEIGIFLASSIDEFKEERIKLGNYIRSLNDIYISHGLYFRLYMCEDMSDAMALTRKQDEYNEIIRQSDFFFILFFKKAGNYTIEEFEVAFEEFRRNNSPRIVTYFKELTDEDSVSEEVMSFMNRLDQEFGHYYSMFQNIDTVKLGMLLEIIRSPKLQMDLEFQNGKVLMNKVEVKDISLENIPYYHKNESLNFLKTEYKAIQEECMDLQLSLQENPEDEELKLKYFRFSQEKNKYEKRIHEIEKEILSMASSVHEMTVSGEYLTLRAKKAIDLFNRGEYAKAILLLDDDERKSETQKIEENLVELKTECQAYVKEIEIKINSIKATGVTKDNVDQIVALYQEAAEMAYRQNLDEGIIIDYVQFLNMRNRYHVGIKAAERAMQWLRGQEKTNLVLIRILASMYSSTECFEAAERLYEESLKAYRNLSKCNPGVYELQLANVCDNLAIIYDRRNQYERAEELYKESLKIYRESSEADSEINAAAIARVERNLAFLYMKLNRYEKAEELFEESLRICKKLNELHPEMYASDVANGYTGLAYFCEKLNRYKEAARLYEETLDIYIELCKKNPEVYEPDEIKAYGNLAGLYHEMGYYESAVNLYEESLDICNKLNKANHGIYDSDIASISCNLAILYMQLNCIEAAEELYIEALKIYKKLVGNNPEVYEPNVALTAGNLANLYVQLKFYETAEGLYEEALEIYRRFSQTNSSVYEAKVAGICNDLGNMYGEIKQYDLAENLYEESLEIYKKLSEINLEVYDSEVAKVYGNLANLYARTNRFESSERMNKEAIGRYRKLCKMNPRVYEPEVARVCCNFAAIHLATRRYEEAEHLLEEALGTYQNLSREYPEVYEPEVARVYCNLAVLYQERNDCEVARTLYESALKIYRGTNYELEMALICSSLAKLNALLGDFGKTVATYQEAINLYERLADKNPDIYVDSLEKTYNLFGDFYQENGYYDEATQQYLKAWKIAREYNIE